MNDGNSSFSARIRSRRTEAGSSFGSCVTSLPQIARSRILDFAFSTEAVSSFLRTSMLRILLILSARMDTILCCSSTGGTGTKYVLKKFRETNGCNPPED